MGSRNHEIERKVDAGGHRIIVKHTREKDLAENPQTVLSILALSPPPLLLNLIYRTRSCNMRGMCQLCDIFFHVYANLGLICLK